MKRANTFVAKPAQVQRSWHLVDLSGEVLGRVTTRIVKLLTGKMKPSYTPNVDSGDFVVAINASKIVVTGRKLQNKLYYWHSGHPGGFQTRTFSQMKIKDSRKIIERAVSGMLPKNKHRPLRLSRLKIFTGSEHPFLEKVKGAISGI